MRQALTITKISRNIISVSETSILYLFIVMYADLMYPPCESASSDSIADFFLDASKGSRTLSVSLSDPLITHIENDAKFSGCSKSQVVNSLLELAYHQLDEYVLNRKAAYNMVVSQ